MRNKQERKERDKDARGRELINWLKDTHILFSMTLSGGKGGGGGRREGG